MESSRPREKLVVAHVGQASDAGLHRPHVAHCLDDVPGAGLALRADHGRALADAAQRLAEVGGAAHEGHREPPFVDVVGVVGWRQHFGFIDVVDAERLENLGLDEVSDPGFSHYRN
jgi:hypothetical protein